MSDKLLTIRQAAKELGVSTKTIRRWEDQGKIESIRTSGGHRRFRLSKVAPHKAVSLNRLLLYIVISVILSSIATYSLSRSYYLDREEAVKSQLDSYINQENANNTQPNNHEGGVVVDTGVGVIRPDDDGNILINSPVVGRNSKVLISSANQEYLEVSQILSGIGFIVSTNKDIISSTYFNWEVSNY